MSKSIDKVNKKMQYKLNGAFSYSLSDMTEPADLSDEVVKLVHIHNGKKRQFLALLKKLVYAKG